ncbi:MAG: thermonuclease family protein [Bacillota bacterium]|nr:thermonuclease family protein [Bacillota bacterium]MDP4154276.1 thermonuclease family protein [Bacillota bacterium]
MERFRKFFAAAILLFGLAACDLINETKKTNKSENTVISATSNAPKTAKEQTPPKQVETNQQTAQGAICNIPGASANAQQYPVIVTETLDGDTIKVIYNGKEETVRYLMVDTPKEKKSKGCEQPYALDAASRNKQLVHSGNVTIEFEFGKSNTDQNGRLLAYVFVNGTSIQETLLKEGLARVSTNDQQRYKYSIPFISAQTIAKKNQLNIWSEADYVTENGFKQCKPSGV